MKRKVAVSLVTFLGVCLLQSAAVGAFGLKQLGAVLGGGNPIVEAVTVNDVDLSSRAERMQQRVQLAAWAFAEALADTAEAAGKMEEAGTIRTQLAASKDDPSNIENTKVLIDTVSKDTPGITNQESLANVNADEAGDLVKRGSLYAAGGYIALGLAIAEAPKLLKEGSSGLKAAVQNPTDAYSTNLNSTVKSAKFVKEKGPALKQAMANYRQAMKQYSANKGLAIASDDEAKEFADSLAKE